MMLVPRGFLLILALAALALLGGTAWVVRRVLVTPILRVQAGWLAWSISLALVLVAAWALMRILGVQFTGVAGKG